MTDLHAPGAKDDASKPRIGWYIKSFQRALLEVTKVAEYGAKKYSENGWQHVPDGYDRYSDAMIRHYLDNSEVDAESGLLHDAHAAWNAIARLELKLREAEQSTKFRHIKKKKKKWKEYKADMKLSEQQYVENLLAHGVDPLWAQGLKDERLVDLYDNEGRN